MTTTTGKEVASGHEQVERGAIVGQLRGFAGAGGWRTPNGEEQAFR
jgi:hypothetical protein